MMLVNGQFSECIDGADRGLAYGDGVFRTLLFRQGNPVHWRQHYAKLAGDCARLGIVCPDESVLRQDMAHTAQAEPDGVVKLIVTRGTGLRGYALSSCLSPNRLVMRSALPAYPAQYVSEGVVARVCELRLACQPRLAGIKHLNRLEQVLARAEWQDPMIAEGLMLDMDHRVVGGTMSNLFLVRGRTLITPAIESCGVAGVTRARILSRAAGLDMSVAVRAVSLDEVLQADEVMLCNSVFGVWQVRELMGRSWRAGSMVSLLRIVLAQEDD